MIELENNRRALYQWELNQRVIVDGYPAGTRVEFSARYDCKNSALPVSAYEADGHVYASIPNILLQAAGYIHVYVSPSASSAQKPQEKDIKVVRREKPENYEYIETPLVTIENKMDRFWGTENKGMALVIGEDGYVKPIKIESAGSGGGITAEDDGEGNVTLTIPSGVGIYDDGEGNVTIG